MMTKLRLIVAHRMYINNNKKEDIFWFPFIHLVFSVVTEFINFNCLSVGNRWQKILAKCKTDHVYLEYTRTFYKWAKDTSRQIINGGTHGQQVFEEMLKFSINQRHANYISGEIYIYLYLSIYLSVHLPIYVYIYLRLAKTSKLSNIDERSGEMGTITLMCKAY